MGNICALLLCCTWIIPVSPDIVLFLSSHPSVISVAKLVSSTVGVHSHTIPTANNTTVVLLYAKTHFQIRASFSNVLSFRAGALKLVHVTKSCDCSSTASEEQSVRRYERRKKVKGVRWCPSPEDGHSVLHLQV